MIKSVVDNTYDWFVGLVAERRNLSPARARRLSDGSIFTGRQAFERGLIDEVGGDEEARAWLASDKGIAEDVPAREWKKEDSFVSIFASDAVAGLARLVGLEPTAAPMLPPRLLVDGLLSVWQAPAVGRTDR